MKSPSVRIGATGKEVLIACNGWFECPKDAHGRRLGPLVGYSKKYYDHDPLDGRYRQYVGDHYADFAMVEEWGDVMHDHVVAPLIRDLSPHLVDLPPDDVVICGVPDGGRSLATMFAEWMHRKCIYPEKVKLETDVEGERAQTVLRFGRHGVFPGDRIVIVEDVCNNFSNTLKLIAEIEAAGGIAAAIACFLNRSEKYREQFTEGGHALPIVAVWNEAMPQWRQDDPAVHDDIVAKNVIFDPKPRIRELQGIMLKHAA